MDKRSDSGFSLIEVMVSLGVLTVGVLGAAAVLSSGMQTLGTSPADVVVTQKAMQAIEAVFAARDSHKLAWAQIRNVEGESGNDGGVFVDGPQPLYIAGPDGLVNTQDDDDDPQIESVELPGHDQLLDTADDNVVELTAYTREIIIRDVPDEAGNLRTVTVIVTYQSGPTKRSYTLSTLISAYS
jgi:prepilin-type N-terminal cleavage/methylation domain-containing protein